MCQEIEWHGGNKMWPNANGIGSRVHIINPRHVSSNHVSACLAYSSVK